MNNTKHSTQYLADDEVRGEKQAPKSAIQSKTIRALALSTSVALIKGAQGVVLLHSGQDCVVW